MMELSKMILGGMAKNWFESDYSKSKENTS